MPPVRSAFGAGELDIGSFVHEMSSVRVVFGAGRIDAVAVEAIRLDGPVLLIAGRRRVREADRIAAELGPRCVGRINEVTLHVPAPLAQRAVELTRDLGAGTVVYDPDLTVELPAVLSAASGMNAIAHPSDEDYAPDASPLTALQANEAIAALCAALPLVVREPANVPARERALYGAWPAATVLGVTTMGLHHQLAQVIGGSYRLPYAGTHSALLPHVVAFNAAAARAERAAPAHAAGAADGDELGAALFYPAAALGAPTSLAGLGLPDTAIDDVVDHVQAAGVANPRAVDAAGLAALLRDALVGRRPGIGGNSGFGAPAGSAAGPTAHRVPA